jgi:hypothetical protein
MPIPKPMPSYFLIRISREQEKRKRQSVGSIIIPETHTFMMYNVQCGEVVGIGAKAHEYFPEVEIGYTLLIHHFVEGANEHESREDHLVHQNEDYNYYVVTCFDFYRKGNETYGVWDGEKIIPNKDYVFLQVPPPVEPVSADDYINSALVKTTSGILTFSNWTDSRETKVQKMQRIKSEIEQLSKSGISKPHVAKGIQEREAELSQLSLNINAKSYEIYTIAAFNPELKNNFRSDAFIEVGAKIYIVNQAAQTEIDFKGTKYIVAKVNYVGGAGSIQDWCS